MVSLRLKYCIGAGLGGHIRPDLRVLRGVRLESYGCVRLTVAGLRGDFAAADAAVRHRHDQTRFAVEWRRIPGIVSQIGPVWVDS